MSPRGAAVAPRGRTFTGPGQGSGVTETEMATEPEVVLPADPALALDSESALAVDPPSSMQKARRFVRRRRWWFFWISGSIFCASFYSLSFATSAVDLTWQLSVAGVLIGILIGLTGMGGGALMTPILILLFGWDPTKAVGNDIAYAAITKIVGSWRHWQRRNVDLKVALYLAAGSVPATLFGVWLIHYIKTHSDIVTINTILFRTIGGALVIVSIALTIKVLIHIDKSYGMEAITLSPLRRAMTILLGAATGFIVGLTSVGSGTFLGLFLILAYPMAMRRIVGTDVFHAMILLLAAAGAQWSIGNVQPWAVTSLLLGSVPGVVLGSHWTGKAPEKVLKICLAVVLFLSGLALLYKKAKA
jgi:uncharacterized membrane protein YfcA